MTSQIKDGIHVVAIDDAPHIRGDSTTELYFVYCKGIFIEKISYTTITVDGLDATSAMLRELKKEIKAFTIILLHSSTVGGLNIVDIQLLSDVLDKPILAVTENPPTDNLIEDALKFLPNSDDRISYKS